jgi:hypothetical protein
LLPKNFHTADCSICLHSFIAPQSFSMQVCIGIHVQLKSNEPSSTLFNLIWNNHTKYSYCINMCRDKTVTNNLYFWSNWLYHLLSALHMHCLLMPDTPSHNCDSLFLIMQHNVVPFSLGSSQQNILNMLLMSVHKKTTCTWLTKHTNQNQGFE